MEAPAPTKFWTSSLLCWLPVLILELWSGLFNPSSKGHILWYMLKRLTLQFPAQVETGPTLHSLSDSVRQGMQIGRSRGSGGVSVGRVLLTLAAM